MQQAMTDGSGAIWNPHPSTVEGLPERPDGNNVNVDRESLLLAADTTSISNGRATDQKRVPSAADRYQGRELTMGLFDMLNISASALSAERQRAEVTSANLANAETTHTDSGGPYVRKEVVFSASNASPFAACLIAWAVSASPPAGSVQLTEVVNDTTPPVMRYEPGNPDCRCEGFCGVSGYQSGVGDGGPDGSRSRLSVECLGGDGAAKQMIQQSIDILKSS